MKQRVQHNRTMLLLIGSALLLLSCTALLMSLAANRTVLPLAQAQASMPTQTCAPAIPGTKTPLGCQQQLADGLSVVVKLTNTPHQTLPKGTRVYWQTQTGIADWVTIASERGLSPKGVLKGLHSDWMKGGPCTAHYFKPTGASAMTPSKIRGPAF